MVTWLIIWAKCAPKSRLRARASTCCTRTRLNQCVAMTTMLPPLQASIVVACSHWPPARWLGRYERATSARPQPLGGLDETARRSEGLSLSLCLATQQCALSALYLSWFGPSEPFVGVCVLAAACKRAASSLPRGRRRKLAVAVSCLLLETESPVARLLASEYSSQASERAARNQFEAAVAQRATSERASERASDGPQRATGRISSELH